MQSHIVIPWILETADWIVFIGVLAITIAAVAYGNFRKKKHLSEDNFFDLLLMGRQLTLPLFVCTLVATWYGGIIGVTALAYDKGFYNFLTQGIFWYVTYIIFALFLVNKIRVADAKTLPETAEYFFGKKARSIVALVNLTNVIPISYAISAGILIQLITGLPLGTSTFAGIAFVLIYSQMSGLRSVVYSDLVQFFVMCSAVAMVLGFSIYNFGGPDFLQARLPQNHFKLLGDDGFWAAFVWGIIALTTLVDPNFHQRCLAATSPKTAKKGILLSTLIWVLFDLCTTFGAMYAKAAIPTAISNEAYITYSVQLLPTGLKGYFLAGMVATIFSTMDSYFFLATTSINYDLVKGRLRDPRFFKTFGVLIAFTTFLLTFGFEGNIANIWRLFGSLSAIVVLIPMTSSYILGKRFNDNDFILSTLIGLSLYLLTELQLLTLASQGNSLYLGLFGSFLGLWLRTLSEKLIHKAQ